ncbi:MAG: single-stranded-DNA-specific exonuclease RecJ [Candidatus Peribacteraceae bacterium]|nr:single-stranded-DNA-specific exonuclease RecJ [Candidatus Peribacteraceae bacterium]
MDNLSLLGKKWVLPQDNSGGDFLARLRKIRGIDASEIHAGEAMCDLQKAAERITQAIEDKEKILVVGDYDADGITASAILFKTIQHLGGTVSVRLPHRIHDGYGLNQKFIEEAKKLGVKLIVTVDNGISACAEVELANSLGMDVIVTDHHTPPAKLPRAFAIVNPKRKDCKYPDKNLSGAAVALKLAEHLGELPEDLRNELYALAAIGTLADVCPLTGENRALVAMGLEALPKIQNVGLRKILANAGVHGGKISAEDIGFRVAPRINAAGRLDDPLMAFQAIANGSGEKYADELERLNRERQDWTAKTLAEIEERLGELGTEKILIASGDFHPGIIGLAAGNLAEKYFRPAIVMSRREGKLVGSCRSPLAEFDITAALAASADLLEKFGGHRGAAGFTVSEANRPEFEKQLSDFAEKNIEQIELTPQLELDLEVGEKDLTEKFLSELNSLAPFGAGNPEPNLLWRDAPLAEVRAIGEDGKHLKLGVGTNKLAAIAFGFGEFADELGKRGRADLVFNFGENAWNGSRELQLKIIDAR